MGTWAEMVWLLIDALKGSPIATHEIKPQESQPFGFSGIRSTSEAVARLPKIQLPTFAGKDLDWPNFWESFKVNIHERAQLKGKQRVDYLHQVLKGQALNKMRGLGLEAENYAAAIAILQDEYENPNKIIHAYWEKMQNPVAVRENLSNLESFIDDIRAASTYLLRQGVSEVALNPMVNLLLKKLPKS